MIFPIIICSHCGDRMAVDPQWPHKRYCNKQCAARARRKRCQERMNENSRAYYCRKVAKKARAERKQREK